MLTAAWAHRLRVWLAQRRPAGATDAELSVLGRSTSSTGGGDAGAEEAAGPGGCSGSGAGVASEGARAPRRKKRKQKVGRVGKRRGSEQLPSTEPEEVGEAEGQPQRSCVLVEQEF